jgi:hypothetical protein
MPHEPRRNDPAYRPYGNEQDGGRDRRQRQPQMPEGLDGCCDHGSGGRLDAGLGELEGGEWNSGEEQTDHGEGAEGEADAGRSGGGSDLRSRPGPDLRRGVKFHTNHPTEGLELRRVYERWEP